MNTPSFKPKCPNHGEPLEGCGFPLPQKGVGICPVSGYPFEFEVETDEETVQKDKFGNIVKKLDWKLTGEENN